MRQDHILLVEDSLSMQLLVRSVLENFCALTCVTSIGDAERALKSESFSLILLDVGLPDGDGLLFCKALRDREQMRDVPIVFLTNESRLERKVMGFTVGADDYITKPFEPEEFLARIEAKLKRKPVGKPVTTVVKHDFRFDLTSQRAFQTDGAGVETELELTPNEFKIFFHLLNHEGVTFSREELLETLWGPSVHVTTHTIATHVSTLRKKIGAYGPMIRGVPKKGYCFSRGEILGKAA